MFAGTAHLYHLNPFKEGLAKAARPNIAPAAIDDVFKGKLTGKDGLDCRHGHRSDLARRFWKRPFYTFCLALSRYDDINVYAQMLIMLGDLEVGVSSFLP